MSPDEQNTDVYTILIITRVAQPVRVRTVASLYTILQHFDTVSCDRKGIQPKKCALIIPKYSLVGNQAQHGVTPEQQVD